MIQLLITTILLLISSSVYAENCFLVSDKGIRVPEPQLVSTPYVRAVPVEVVPVTQVYGDVLVKTYVEYEGEVQTQENTERAGFYSIITAKDI